MFSTPDIHTAELRAKRHGWGQSHLRQLGDRPRYLFLLLAVVLVCMLSLYSGLSKDLAGEFGCSGWDANMVETLLPYL